MIRSVVMFTINSSKSRLDYVESSPSISIALKEYIYQVGGHGMKSNKKYQTGSQLEIITLPDSNELKILNDAAGVLYKPVQNFPKGEMEIKFYQNIFDTKHQNPVVKDLQKFIPKFLGLFSCDDPLKENLYIGIEDLLFQFKLPSVADVKIGQKSYEPDVRPEKKQTEIEKYKWRESVGFLITGIRVYEPTTLFLNRYHGRSLDPEEVYTKGLKVFLGTDSVRAQLLAGKFIEKLNGLLNWFKSQKEMAFIASSVLMAYESGRHNESNGESESNGVCVGNVLVKWIDFTHVLPVTDHDHNCIYGIESLIKYFDRVKRDNNY